VEKSYLFVFFADTLVSFRADQTCPREYVDCLDV